MSSHFKEMKWEAMERFPTSVWAICFTTGQDFDIIKE
jgi:hypothetical protein